MLRPPPDSNRSDTLVTYTTPFRYATTGLAGVGGVQAAGAIAANDSNPPVTVPPMAQRAGFADLVARVKPAVVNIATTEKVDDKSGQQQMPNFPPGSPFEEFFRQFMEQQQIGRAHV